MSLATANLTCRVLPAHDAPIQSLAFGPAGRMATGDVNRTVRLWRGEIPFATLDLRTRQEKIRPTERIRGLSFSPDGKAIFAACGDLMRAFDSDSGAELWAYRPPRSWGFLIVSPISITVSAEGDVAMATDAGRLSVWTANGAMKSHWSDNDSPRVVAFADNDRLVGTDSFSLCVWRASTGRKIAKRKLDERVYGMAVSPDGRHAVVRTIHGVEAIDTETLETVDRYPTGLGLPLLAFSPDGKRLAICDNVRIGLYEVGDGPIATLEATECRLRSMRFTPDGHSVVAGCSDGALRTWDLPF